MSVYMWYRCMITKDGKVVAVVIRRGQFLNCKHFHALLARWNGRDANGCNYLFYETTDPGCLEIPALADHTNNHPELAGTQYVDN